METNSGQASDVHEVQDLFADYCDGTLASARKAEVDAHLNECATCRDALAEYRATLVHLSGLGRVGAPSDLGQAVADRIRTRSAGRFFARKHVLERVPIKWIVLVVVLISGVLFALWRTSTTGSVPDLRDERRDRVGPDNPLPKPE